MRYISENGLTTRYPSFDSFGNVTLMIRPGDQDGDRETVYENYKLGIPQLEKQPEGVNIIRVVDANGFVEEITDGEGHTTTFEYDNIGRKTLVVYPQGDPADIAYDSQSVVYTRGEFTAQTMLDPFGRIASETAGGVTKNYHYDAFGRKVFESHPNSLTEGTDYSYLSLNLLDTITHNDDTTVKHFYDQNQVRIEDERGKSTTHVFRAYGDPDETYLMEIISPVAAASITLGRDAADRVETVLQDGVTRSYTYTPQHHVETVTEPERSVVVYGRDLYGNMTSITLNDKYISYDYDKRNRLTGVDYRDASTPDASFIYDKRDNRTQSSQGGIVRDYHYRPNGQLENETLTVDGLVFNLGYGYDDLDRLESLTYPDGEITNYTPDLLGRPTQVSPVATHVAYHPNSAFSELTYANGVSTTQVLDDRLRIHQHQIRKLDNTGTAIGTFYDATLLYDDAGNLKSLNDTVNFQNNRSMFYDEINRLTNMNGPWGQGFIGYDGRGNIRFQRLGDDGGGIGVGRSRRINSTDITYSYDLATNRLARVSGSTFRTFSYDDWGNVTDNGQNTFLYDDARNMVCVDCSGSTAVQYAYDTDNMRVRRVKDGLNTYFIYASNGNLVMEYTPGEGHYKLHGHLGSKQIATVTQTKPDLDMDSDGTPDASEIGQEPGVVETTHELLFLHTDIVGSPILATDYKQEYAGDPGNPAQGEQKWTENYFPYGQRREQNGDGNTEWFGGKTLDSDTGLSYFGARYYDAAIGRFMAVDPVGANPESIHLQNRYAYANNNPYRFVDPDGRLACGGVCLIAIASIAYAAYDGYQDDGASGALAEASGYNDAVSSYNSFRDGDYSGAALSIAGVACKACKGAKAVAKGRLRVDGGDFSQSEINAAWHMASQGKKVHLRQPVGTRAGGGTSDLLVDGMRYDVYTPTTGNASRIISAMAKKNSQTEGIVLDLSKTKVTADQLGNALGRVNGTGATNISDIVIMGK